LDFILKVTSTFKDVDIYWLLNGKGNFPKENTESNLITPTPLFNEKASIESSTEKRIQKIVVFYTDGTFEEYKK
jgi:hypothetical protein